MSTKINMGVIGAGTFGRYHAGKLFAHERINFLGIYDPDLDRANMVAKEFNTQVFATSVDLYRKCDAIIIACPATFHAYHALEALKENCHILVEKPLATDVNAAQQIVDLAHSKNLIVQVGHQERFVAQAIGLDRVIEVPQRITAKRMGKVATRGIDTSVTMDLMTHDIDMALWLFGEVPNSVRGDTISIYSSHPDVSLARLTFSHGSARLEASRAEDGFERIMEINYPSGTVRIDFNAKTLEHDTPFDLNVDFASDPKAKDSLAAGTHEFVQAILKQRSPLVTGQDGLNAVKVAAKVDMS